MASSPATPFPPHPRKPVWPLVTAIVAMSLAAPEAMLFGALWASASRDPDALFLLAIFAVGAAIPAVLLIGLSITLAIVAIQRRERATLILSIIALACHIPLVAALMLAAQSWP